MNLACSGLAPNTREADWLAMAGDNERLRNGMERLYRLFQKASVLGSLINPFAAEGDLLVAGFHELQPLLEQTLAQESQDDTAHEMAVDRARPSQGSGDSCRSVHARCDQCALPRTR
jgi:hypothetical protein